MEVLEYQTSSGRRPYLEWLRQLKDVKGAVVIRNHIKRLRQGHWGDHKSLGDSVWELRIFFGTTPLIIGDENEKKTSPGRSY